MYEKIKNPETGRYVSIYGLVGQKVIANYLEVYQYGGGDNFLDKEEPESEDDVPPPPAQPVLDWGNANQ